MRFRKLYLGVLAYGILGGVSWLTITRVLHNRDVVTQAQTLREQMVYVEGGAFQMGNYQINYRRPDGTVTTIWAADFQPSEQRQVTLKSYYIAAYEVSYESYNTHLQAQGYPPLHTDNTIGYQQLDRAASVSFDEAKRFCAWAGEITELPMRLPTEAEWEFAARSRGQFVSWATNDGNYRPGENVVVSGDRDSSYKEINPPIGVFPPNPLGLYNLQDGLYEWVTGQPGFDPPGAAISKGGSNFSSRFYETIPRRGVHSPLSDAQFPAYESSLRGEALARHKRQDDPYSPIGGYIGIRCVAGVSDPPLDSGFGHIPAQDITLSPPFYGHQN
ncbi:hypothetical protein BFP70_01630 [Thioclava sp. SK-1]|uniref:formylglycine-generating enzyme family protein n=1 Tax=Thioclava sp. SK-1 TaxID=1889770 RepID=UPI0008263F5C|nr:SUMF1/EgtB/PvdO family nonheme iron enzyme [Thioclava sp. SK-1]OCX67320.1 hypothetical protein BFP70_01630 [Thioclava sp. SK-1]